MRREDIPEYPLVALREVLADAVAHADYSARTILLHVQNFTTGSKSRIRVDGR
jgi:predicted HTH transcriptional regulator